MRPMFLMLAAVTGCATAPIPAARPPVEEPSTSAAAHPPSAEPASEAPASEELDERPVPATAQCVPDADVHTCATPADASACALEVYWAARAHLAQESYPAAFRAFDAAFEADHAGEAAGFAVMLALDTLIRRQRELDGPNDCDERIRAALARYRAALCAGTIPGWEDECEHLDRMACALRQRSALELARDDEAAASVRFEALANDPHCREHQAEHLYNAALTAERSGDPSRAASLRERLQREHPGAFDPAADDGRRPVPIVE